MTGISESERRFVDRAVRRKRVFLILAGAGVAVGLSLGVFYLVRRLQDPGYPVGVRLVLVLLVLLNARQNLRQYRYASALEKLEGPGPVTDPTEDRAL